VVADALADAPAYREPPCRNCGAPAGDAYCPQCGQETSTRLPSARQFLKEAAGRYVAFDGRMWRTLAALLLRPGHLTLEYFAGRRRRYIRPARLFLVLSLVLFALMRIVVGVPQLRDGAVTGDTGPAAVRDATGVSPTATGGRPARGARVLLPGLALHVDRRGEVTVDGEGLLASELRPRFARFNALPPQEKIEQVVLGIMRYGPYAMFVMLPAFALLLMVVYAGRHRPYPTRPRRYAEHLVFAAHNHAFVFLVLGLATLAPVGPLRALLLAWAVVYLPWSLRTVYGGSWVGLLLRAWVLIVAYAVLNAFVTVGLLVAAVAIR
jgi:hypothetical protein